MTLCPLLYIFTVFIPSEMERRLGARAIDYTISYSSVFLCRLWYNNFRWIWTICPIGLPTVGWTYWHQSSTKKMHPEISLPANLMEALLCVKTFLGETQHTPLSTPDRKPVTEQNMASPKFKLVNQWVFLGLFTGVSMGDYLQEQ